MERVNLDVIGRLFIEPFSDALAQFVRRFVAEGENENMAWVNPFLPQKEVNAHHQRGGLPCSRPGINDGRALQVFRRPTLIIIQRYFAGLRVCVCGITFEKEIEELTKLVAEGEGSFATMHPTNTADMASISDEPLRAAFAVQEAKLRQTEAELSPIKIVAPMDGTIIAVHFRSGESVTPGRPIVTIAADTPTRIIGYLRQPAVIEPRPGSTVTVRTRGIRRLTGTARVIEVGSQLDTMPQVLQSPVKLAGVELALPVDITVPANLKLRPGELVDITFTP